MHSTCNQTPSLEGKTSAVDHTRLQLACNQYALSMQSAHLPWTTRACSARISMCPQRALLPPPPPPKCRDLLPPLRLQLPPPPMPLQPAPLLPRLRPRRKCPTRRRDVHSAPASRRGGGPRGRRLPIRYTPRAANRPMSARGSRGKVPTTPNRAPISMQSACTQHALSLHSACNQSPSSRHSAGTKHGTQHGTQHTCVFQSGATQRAHRHTNCFLCCRILMRGAIR